MKKFLVIAPAWLGDIIMSQSLFKLLKLHNPDCQIDVLAPKWCFEILARMPEVNNKFVLPIGHGELKLLLRYKLGRQLKAEKYHEAIILPNSYKSALIPYFAKIPIRTGWLGELRYGVLTHYQRLNKELLPRIVDRYSALGNNFNVPQQACIPHLTTEHNQELLLNDYSITVNKPILILCPGSAYGPAKRWPIEYYAKLADLMLPTMDVWIMGSGADVDIASNINTLTDNRCYNLTGKTTLPVAVDFMALATAVVSNDSGLLHMAAALGKPTIGIYGSTSEQVAPPLQSQSRAIFTNVDCRPCNQRRCPLPEPRFHRCMLNITPNQVQQVLEQIIND